MLTRRALTDSDLLKYGKALKIPHFRGVFMRNELSTRGPHRYESGIINVDDKNGPVTHWVAYKKSNNETLYFDGFDSLQLPSDLVKYLDDGSFIKYNYSRYQEYDTFECGHLCLKFLCDQKCFRDDINSKLVIKFESVNSKTFPRKDTPKIGQQRYSR